MDQEPAAIGTQTVREILLTAANLRLPETVTTDQKKMRIMALVTELGIEHILDRKYGEEGTSLLFFSKKKKKSLIVFNNQFFNYYYTKRTKRNFRW